MEKSIFSPFAAFEEIGEVNWVRNVSPDLEWARGIEQYIAASHMDRDTTWGRK